MKEVEIKVKVPEGVIEYCERNKINIQDLIDTALKHFLFERVYTEMVS